ncbi:hypothetical protein BKA64DRAFT_710465 [Cadophora sp. MPI-SDFR-AT-0126]|nr:hypothetical protein BKA64DRAFT_710465 [Leotiomycetes sp. MPI-SDFR-AT-0126]
MKSSLNGDPCHPSDPTERAFTNDPFHSRRTAAAAPLAVPIAILYIVTAHSIASINTSSYTYPVLQPISTRVRKAQYISQAKAAHGQHLTTSWELAMGPGVKARMQKTCSERKNRNEKPRHYVPLQRREGGIWFCSQDARRELRVEALKRVL